MPLFWNLLALLFYVVLKGGVEGAMCITSKTMFYSLGCNVYYIEKHVIRLDLQSVLNRKACYTPRCQCV